jgi:hypothetical protein
VRIVSVSVEPRGPSALKHGMLAMGWVVGRGDRPEVLSRHRAPLNSLLLHNGGGAERDHNAAVMRGFREVLDHLEEQCFTVVIVSGAPGRDYHFINTYLEYCGLPGLNTTITGSYRPTHSTLDYARGILGSMMMMRDDHIIEALGLPMNIETTDYVSDSDAHYTYRLHWHMVSRRSSSI